MVYKDRLNIILILEILLIGSFLYVAASAVGKPIDCAITKDSPYSAKPMVCKVVLKIP